MRYVTGDIVTEVIGSGRAATRSATKIASHDAVTCRTENGHVYRRDTGGEYLRGDVYRAIHDPAYDAGGEKRSLTIKEIREHGGAKKRST